MTAQTTEISISLSITLFSYYCVTQFLLVKCIED